jgi:predicted small secreted protein
MYVGECPSERVFRTSEGDITMKLSRLASFAAILLCALELSGCANTARGAAKDVTTTVDAAVE